MKSGVFTWSKDYLFKVLTEGKNAAIYDPKIAAAFRAIDRADFVLDKHKDLAYQDTDIDLGYGETLTRPTFIAQMMQHLAPKFGGKYLDVGSGSGYFAVLLGFIAGETGSVFSIERIGWLWEMSKSNAKLYEEEVSNIKFLYRDGIEGLLPEAPFDGIHISFAIEQIPQNIKMQLKVGARLVVPSTHNDLRIVERIDEENFTEEIIPGYVFEKGKEGIG